MQTRARGRSRHTRDVAVSSPLRCKRMKISTRTFPVFCLSVPPLPFHCQQNKTTRRLHFINSRPRPKREGEMTLGETPRDFIPFLRGDNFFELDFSFSFFFSLSRFFFYPHTVSLPRSPQSTSLTGHRGKALISLSTQILCVCYSRHISVRCGSPSG